MASFTPVNSDPSVSRITKANIQQQNPQSFLQELERLETLEPMDRYKAMIDLNEAIASSANTLGQAAELLESRLKKFDYNKIGQSRAEFMAQFESTISTARSYKTNQARLETARDSVRKHMGKEPELLWPHLWTTRNSVDQLVALLNTVNSKKEYIQILNHVFMNRLEAYDKASNKTGLKKTPQLLVSDIITAVKLAKEMKEDGKPFGDLPHHSDSVLAQRGLFKDPSTGAILPNSHSSRRAQVEGSVPPTPTATRTADRVPTSPGQGAAFLNQATTFESPDTPIPTTESGSPGHRRTGSQTPITTEAETLVRRGISAQRARSTSVTASTTAGPGLRRSARNKPPPLSHSTPTRESRERSVHITPPPDTRRALTVRTRTEEEDDCHCTISVPDEWKQRLTVAGPYDQELIFELLGTYRNIIRRTCAMDSNDDYPFPIARPKAKSSKYAVCRHHSDLLGWLVGINKDWVSNDLDVLVSLLVYLYESRHKIGALKSSPDSFLWFREDARPGRPSDGLFPYRFRHDLDYYQKPTGTPANVIARIIHVRKDAVRLNIARDLLKSWETGHVSLHLFHWLLPTSPKNKKSVDESLITLMREELDVYRFHHDTLSTISMAGEMLGCYYSLTQQIIYQDPELYVAHVMLRKNHNYRLVAWPSAAIFVDPSEKSIPVHYAVNAAALAHDGTGSGYVDCTVNLDSEEGSTSTVIIPGLTVNKFKSWWKRLASRDAIPADGWMTDIRPDHLTKGDRELLGIDSRIVNAEEGFAHFFNSITPHGRTLPNKRIRQIRPQYVGLQEDCETLEVVGVGTWDELSRGHRDLRVPATRLFGRPHIAAPPSYRLPIDLHFDPCCPLSAALVGKKRWDDPEVLLDMNKWLMPKTDASYTTYRRQYRASVAKQFREKMLLKKLLEQDAFKAASYYRHLRDGTLEQAVNLDESLVGLFERTKVSEGLGETAADSNSSRASGLYNDPGA